MKERTWPLCPILIVTLAGGISPASADPPAPAPPAPPVAGGAPRAPAEAPSDRPPPPNEPEARPAEPALAKQKVVMADFAYIHRGVSPDVTLATGARVVHGDGDQTRWWYARARAGVMVYNEPSFLILGLTGQFNPLDSASLGVELEYLNLWRGYWGLAGLQFYDSAGGATFEGALGYTLFGVEYQRRISGDRKDDQALMLMLHVPFGVVRVLRQQDLRPIVVPE